MTQVTEAIYSDGVLKLDRKLPLQDQQRVRVIVQTLDTPSSSDRAEALDALKKGVREMRFRSNGAYPTRDELHERR